MNARPFLVRGNDGIRRASTPKFQRRVEVSTRKILHESPRTPFNR